MNKKLFKLLLSILNVIGIFLVILFAVIITRNIKTIKNDYSFLEGKSNKVVLFIGDGMGENHIKISSLYLDKEPVFNSFSKNGYVSTFSKQLFLPTDSAAAATALATGKKVNNKEISYHKGKEIESISEYAKSLGYGVGVITTDDLFGATPASFSSHATSRSNVEEIIASQLISDIDLFLGSGYDTYVNYREKFEKNGYDFISKYSNLNITDHKIIGSFTKINNYNTDNNLPTLPKLTEFAIDYFEENYPNGYFIMIEAAHIDKKSHDNNIFEMINYFNEFNNSIDVAYKKLSNESNASIIVTADHETGNLTNTENVTNISNKLYKSKGHTNKKVKYAKIYKQKQKSNGKSIAFILKLMLYIFYKYQYYLFFYQLD